MKKHYKVIAKCGHVGKGYYYEGAFYIDAEDGRQAATIVRKMARVKHNHKDAILYVAEISNEEYMEGRKKHREDKFFKCKNIQEQNAVFDSIKDNIKEDPHNQKLSDKRFIDEQHQEERHARVMYKQKKMGQLISSFKRMVYEFCEDDVLGAIS